MVYHVELISSFANINHHNANGRVKSITHSRVGCLFVHPVATLFFGLIIGYVLLMVASLKEDFLLRLSKLLHKPPPLMHCYSFIFHMRREMYYWQD